MAVRGVYSEAERKMLDDSNKKADMMVGWVKLPARKVVTEESLIMFARSVDCWNPLWNDDSYAMNTKWGGIIAVPFFQDRIGAPSPADFQLEVPPELGFLGRGPGGYNRYEFSKPIKVNDTIRIWRRRPKIEDITGLDGQGPRTFSVELGVDFINQRDEPVGATILNSPVAIVPQRPPGLRDLPPVDEKLPTYTEEDLEFIRLTEDGEEIRGASLRYWEDVNVGDELKPVIAGPTTIIDMIQVMGYAIMEMPSMREIRRSGSGELLADPATGVIHHQVEAHLTDQAVRMFGPSKYAHHFIVYGRNQISRLVTNWMGDEGFLRVIQAENPGDRIVKELVGKDMQPHPGHVLIGDTLLGKGKVIDKRVENDEYLVDIAAWVENLEGYLTSAAVATVSLCSKESIR